MQTLTSINRYTTKKDGSPLMTSKGRPYTSVRIKTQEHGDVMISGFGNAENAGWKVGDSVDITVVQKGEYWNFEMPKRDSNTTGDKFGNNVAEIKNYLDLKIMPMLERINAGQAKQDLQLSAIYNILNASDIKDEPDEDEMMSNLDKVIDDPTS